VCAQGAQDLRGLRRGHGGELGRQAGPFHRHHGDQQPSDLLELVPFQHPADRRLRPRRLRQHRQDGQGAGLAALFDRERRQRVRPRRGTRARQDLSVVQEPLRVARGGEGTDAELSSARRFDSAQIHAASLPSHLTWRSSPARRHGASPAGLPRTALALYFAGFGLSRLSR
jgi:hypothetical protein